MAQFMFERALQSDLLFWLAVQATPSLVMRTILATPEGLLTQVSAQERDRAQRMMDHILPLAARQQGLLNDAAVAASLPRLEIESIRAPTLAISVADDGYGTLDGARYSAEHIPGARLIAYPTGGHLWLGHHREMVEEIGRFLHAAVPAAGRS
jgi:pimeloyl-ACP methyl ester carboxylesterase